MKVFIIRVELTYSNMQMYFPWGKKDLKFQKFCAMFILFCHTQMYFSNISNLLHKNIVVKFGRKFLQVDLVQMTEVFIWFCHINLAPELAALTFRLLTKINFMFSFFSLWQWANAEANFCQPWLQGGNVWAARWKYLGCKVERIFAGKAGRRPWHLSWWWAAAQSFFSSTSRSFLWHISGSHYWVTFLWQILWVTLL